MCRVNHWVLALWEGRKACLLATGLVALLCVLFLCCQAAAFVHPHQPTITAASAVSQRGILLWTRVTSCGHRRFTGSLALFFGSTAATSFLRHRRDHLYHHPRQHHHRLMARGRDVEGGGGGGQRKETEEVGGGGGGVADIEDLGQAFWGHDDDYHSIGQDEALGLRHALLTWYDANRRKLPWRGDPPPHGNSNATTISTKKASSATLTVESGGKRQLSILNFTASSGASSRGKKAQKVSVTDVATASLSSSSSSSSSSPDGEKAGRLAVSAYGTWVSEVMLQQTRVETVIEYYIKWMEKFPTAEALAKASDEDVNAAWAGLGYYRRARMLKEGAMAVVDKHQGELPSDVAGLLSIPGIGPYTAGAIASIAFNRPAPVVDGNVIRVLSRLRAVVASPKHGGLVKWAWKAATQLVEADVDRPGDFNQAVMELGATVCTPKSPSCTTCPIAKYCQARALDQHQQKQQQAPSKQQQELKKQGAAAAKDGKMMIAASDDSKEKKVEEGDSLRSTCTICSDEEAAAATTTTTTTTTTTRLLPTPSSLPLVPSKKPPRVEKLLVAIIEKRNTAGGASSSSLSREFLMVKRPETGLLAGQWEFPNVGEEEGHEAMVQGLPLTAAAAGGGGLKWQVRRGDGGGGGDGGDESWAGVMMMMAAVVVRPGADGASEVYAAAAADGGGGDDDAVQCLGELSHVFSHVRHDMQVHWARMEGGGGPSPLLMQDKDGRQWEWVSEAGMEERGVTTGVKKLIKLLDGGGGKKKAMTKRQKQLLPLEEGGRKKKKKEEEGEEEGEEEKKTPY